MTFQVDQTCYPTALAAAQAVASKQEGGLVVSTGNGNGANSTASVYGVSVMSVSSSNIVYQFKPPSGASLTVSVPFTGQPCNMLALSDGVQLGWAVAAVWIAAYAVVFLARALRGETVGNYGNA